MAEILPEIETFARIKVVGIGGGGNNALNRMVQSKLHGIDFVAINTDAQALHYSQANKKVHIGKEATKGLGAGANPDIGKQAAEESEEEIYSALKHSEMVFLTICEGGGTGSGAAPVIARIAKEVGALTVAIVTKPFTFEGDRRRKIAESGVEELRDKVDTLIVIPNDRILQIIDRKTSLLDAFGTVDDVLRQGVQGIADLITVNGLVNLDFADVKSIMHDAGSALMGIGQGSGDTRAVDAVKQAMESPLLEVSIQGAKGVLINFTGGRDMGMHEIEEAAKLVHDSVDQEANIIFGTVIDENMAGEIRVTLVATGFDGERRKRQSYTDFSGLQEETVIEEVDIVEEVPSTPFIEEEKEQPIFDAHEHEPMVKAEPDVPAPEVPDEEPDSPFKPEAKPAQEEELIGFDMEKDLLKEESKREPVREKPIVETVGSRFDDEEEDDLDKPAFLRQNVKVEEPSFDDDDDIPSFVKRKM